MSPAKNILDQVLSSCQRVVRLTRDVSIDTVAVQELAASFNASEVLACGPGTQLPVKFDSQEAEISFLALYHMLDFGTAYDCELQRRHRRDQREVLQYGMLGMHMATPKLDTSWMTTFNAGMVASQFGIDPREDVAVAHLPGVTMSTVGSLAPLVSRYAQCVCEAATALEEEGAASLGQAILTIVNAQTKNKSETPAAALVLELMDVIPAFADQGLYEGEKVVFARKAQALVLDLYCRFHRHDPRFAFADISNLKSDSGATVIAALVAKGVLKPSSELASVIDQGTDIPPGAQERALRAAAVCAVDALTTLFSEPGVTAAHLGVYLWSLTEPGQPLHDRIRKHCTHSTVAY